MTPRHSNYDKSPCLLVDSSSSETWVGWQAILDRLEPLTSENSRVACIDCYPGAFEPSIRHVLAEGLHPAKVIYTPELLKAPREIDQMLEGILGDDPVFARMSGITLQEFFEPSELLRAHNQSSDWREGLLLVVGVGASLVSPRPDLLIYADMARWEIQGRQRRNEIANLGSENFNESASLKYKQAFFVDWRAADRLKKELLAKIDFFLDTNGWTPKMVAGQAVREGLKKTSHTPFRVLPYFDPGPWGGHWMEEVCDLPHDAANHAWCFDCVPEENSLLLGFGGVQIELPAIDLTFFQPRELLGDFITRDLALSFPFALTSSTPWAAAISRYRCIHGQSTFDGTSA